MPMMPPAPLWFSMTTDCFSRTDIACATSLADVSVPPPAGNGTTSLIGRSGKDWASAKLTTPSARIVARISRVRNNLLLLGELADAALRTAPRHEVVTQHSIRNNPIGGRST